MTSIGILGAAGRMGRAIAEAAAEAGAPVAGGVDRDGAVVGDHADARALAGASDVLVDFSSPAALATHLGAAVASKTPIVVGTTGLTEDSHALIDQAAQHVPVLQAANTSLGIAMLRHLVEDAARRLGPEWDIEILEMHHRHKVDAPSGTGLLLGDAAATGRGGAAQVTDRSGKREVGTIGHATLRGGSVAGDHQVIFAGDGERIELGHRAESRAIFARGAVKAALWLSGKPAGRYSMKDVLGL